VVEFPTTLPLASVVVVLVVVLPSAFLVSDSLVVKFKAAAELIDNPAEDSADRGPFPMPKAGSIDIPAEDIVVRDPVSMSYPRLPLPASSAERMLLKLPTELPDEESEEEEVADVLPLELLPRESSVDMVESEVVLSVCPYMASNDWSQSLLVVLELMDWTLMSMPPGGGKFCRANRSQCCIRQTTCRFMADGKALPR
jgi:hypothetical protein